MGRFETDEMQSVCIRQALLLLLQGHDFARQLGRDTWEFAVGLSELQAQGVSTNALRWLLARGLVEHAVEVEPGLDQLRTFQVVRHWALNAATCFVLTASGLALALRLASLPASSRTSAEDGSPLPSWDPVRRTLSFRANVVKHFKVPAPNQELILAVFEEEDWPYRIDDPLPLVGDIEPKRRLHDTINALNRHHRASLLRFLGDGQGKGVCWEVATLGAEAGVTRPSPERLYTSEGGAIESDKQVESLLGVLSIRATLNGG